MATLEGAAQVIPLGPVASQEVIKELGTNGGGFFNANSAHPFENPTPLTNFIEMLLILCIPAALTYTFGRMAGNQKQGWAILAAMAILLVAGIATAYASEVATRARRSPRSPSIMASATWRARKLASAWPIPPCGRRSPPAPRAAQSIRCTTASIPSAAWFRW